MTRRHLPWILLLLLLTVLVPGDGARANGLAADVSDRLIAITTAFVGGDVVVFGAVDEAGTDVVITIQGPRREQMVQRKSRIAGIWINRDRVAFNNVPSYFAIASSRPLDEIASAPVRDQFHFGVRHLGMVMEDRAEYSLEERAAFADALIRNKQRIGLYNREPGKVTFPGARLFRTRFSFPANVPPGYYQVEVFKLKDGQVAGAQRSSLQISKIGLEAEVFDFAHERSALYGMIAIIIAVAAGWIAGVVFRRA